MASEPNALGPILIVDDDAGTRDMLCTTLEAEGYRTATAENGRAAIEYLCNEEVPSLILLDLMMPVMDGWQLRLEQQKEPTIASIPVIVITGLADESLQAEKLNANAVLTKPVGREMLLKAVRQHGL